MCGRRSAGSFNSAELHPGRCLTRLSSAEAHRAAQEAEGISCSLEKLQISAAFLELLCCVLSWFGLGTSSCLETSACSRVCALSCTVPVSSLEKCSQG